MLDRWRSAARSLKQETYALYFAARDPRTPWYARALAFLILAYALSPIDLIPDFIPVLGYLDDLLLVPLGLAMLVRLMPEEVLSDARQRARVSSAARPTSRAAAVVIVLIWVAAGLATLYWIWKRFA